MREVERVRGADIGEEGGDDGGFYIFGTIEHCRQLNENENATEGWLHEKGADSTAMWQCGNVS
jgi:hypothetical protein